MTLLQSKYILPTLSNSTQLSTFYHTVFLLIITISYCQLCSRSLKHQPASRLPTVKIYKISSVSGQHEGIASNPSLFFLNYPWPSRSLIPVNAVRRATNFHSWTKRSQIGYMLTIFAHPIKSYKRINSHNGHQTYLP